jgi:hypothetical protein
VNAVSLGCVNVLRAGALTFPIATDPPLRHLHCPFLPVQTCEPAQTARHSCANVSYSSRRIYTWVPENFNANTAPMVLMRWERCQLGVPMLPRKASLTFTLYAVYDVGGRSRILMARGSRVKRDGNPEAKTWNFNGFVSIHRR